jgi:hypothetical protein
LQLGVGGEAAVQKMAPAAPLAADIEQHPPPAGFRLAQGARNVLRGIAGGIELIHVARDRGIEQGGTEQEKDSKGASNHMCVNFFRDSQSTEKLDDRQSLH